MRAIYRAAAADAALDNVVSAAAADFTDFRSIGKLVYARTATILDTFAEVYGADKIRRALKAYALEHRFSHPAPADLEKATVSDASFGGYSRTQESDPSGRNRRLPGKRPRCSEGGKQRGFLQRSRSTT